MGDGLKINCLAKDGTIEGIEALDSSQRFLLAVQWHPERMKDQENPLARNLKKSFLDRCRGLS
jgi:putative glutamine amidotransferase